MQIFFPRESKPIEYTVDGWRLERWLAKTLINVAPVQQDCEIDVESLIDYIYQGKAFEPPLGIYLSGTAPIGSDDFQITPLIAKESNERLGTTAWELTNLTSHRSDQY